METNLTFNRLPENQFTFNRVNLLLGANGTGKSKLLKELKDNAQRFYPGRLVIFVEGGRTIKLVDSLQLNRNNFNQYNTLEKANTTFISKRKTTLSDRVTDALLLLDKMGQEIRGKHSDEVHEWAQNGMNGSLPVREDPPLTKLFQLFTEIFPSIQLQLNSTNKALTCTKNGSANYSTTQLSDGEKQVLSILADIAILAESNSLIIVDEPELNLNPSLACRLWDTIENDLQGCIFIYGTHNVGFSMRTNVNRVFVLSNVNENISEIKNISEIQNNDLRSLLGNIPAILSTSNALITEGQNNSFDSIFYRWLTGTENIEIVPMGGCGDVQAVANRTGVWEAIAPSVKLVGIIDLDYKSEETIESLLSDNCKMLDFHEAESYLCIPGIVVTVAEKIGLVETLPTIEDLHQLIKQEFENLYLTIAAQRVFEKAKIKLSVSIDRTTLKTIENEDDLSVKLIEEAKNQTDYAEQELSEEKITQLLSAEINNCKKAIEENDIMKMVKLLPGKGLLTKITYRTGAKNPSDYARACSKHIKIDDFKALTSLKERIDFN